MATVNELLDAMGMTGKLREGTDSMLATMRENLAASGNTVAPEKWAEFERELRAHPLDTLLLDATRNALTLTPEEMDAVVAFYRSEKGKRIMEKMTLVNQVVDRASQTWAERKMKAALTKVGLGDLA